MNIENLRLSNSSVVELINNIGESKTDFAKLYHWKGAVLTIEGQNDEFVFGENNKFHQIANAYFSFDINIRREDHIYFTKENNIGGFKNRFALRFKEASIKTFGGSVKGKNEHVVPLSTSKRVLRSGDDDLQIGFSDIPEKMVIPTNTDAIWIIIGNHNGQFNKISLRKILLNNHTIPGKKGRTVSERLLEHVSCFCKIFWKFTKSSRFH